MRDLAECVIALTRSPSVLAFEPLPMDDPRQRNPDISLARSTIGWSPKVGMEEGLAKTIGYFRSMLGCPA